MAKRQLACLIGLLVLVARPVWAAPISLGDFTGATVEFTDVVADDGTLIGPATLNGDSLDFSPRLSSGSAGGSSSATVATLTFGLAAKPGFAIDSFTAEAYGILSLTGLGTALTTAMEAIKIDLIIDEVDGNPIAPVTQPISASVLFQLFPNPFEDEPWSVLAGASLPGILTLHSVPFTFGATHALISFTDTLSTTSEDGSTASIRKDTFSVAAETIPMTAVPEPSSLCLVGLGVMAAYRRLRRV